METTGQNAAPAARARRSRTAGARAALRAAFPVTLPIFAAYWLIGLGYALFAMRQGMPWWFPALTAAAIYSGSVEFILASMAHETFRPAAVFLMAFLVGARHLFYGVSMLDRFKGAGWRKFFMVYMLADETFAITWNARVPEGVDRHSFQTAASVLLWTYWLSGTLAGTLAAHALPIPLDGGEFVMTAMFVAIFAENWRTETCHAGSLAGLGASLAALFAFGPDAFMVPAMAGIVALLLLLRRHLP